MAEKGEATKQLFLGLIAEEPNTVSGVQDKIDERFLTSRFSDSLAATAAKRLLQAGLIQVVEGDERRPVERLRLTASGMEAFAKWLYAPACKAPPFRDATRMRLHLCPDLVALKARSSELTREIEACQKAQRDAEERLGRATKRMKLQAREQSWRSERDCLLLADEVMMWADRENALYRLQRNLDRLLERHDCGDAR